MSEALDPDNVKMAATLLSTEEWREVWPGYLAAARAEGRQEMIDALRDGKRFHAWRHPSPAPWQRKPEPREPNQLAALYLDSITKHSATTTATTPADHVESR